jgi:hypothetical protein
MGDLCFQEGWPRQIVGGTTNRSRTTPGPGTIESEGGFRPGAPELRRSTNINHLKD